MIRLSAIGDVVRTLPALSSLRRQYPRSYIAWAVEDKSSGILEGHPHLDEIIKFERADFVRSLKNPARFHHAISLLTRFFAQLRRRNYDMVLDFHGFLKSGLVAAFAGSPRKIGFEKEFVKECNHLFTNEKVGLPDPRLPRVTRNLEMIKPFVSGENLTDKPALGLTEKHRDKARGFIHEKFGDSHPLTVVHPGTSRNLKKWPLQSFARLCDMLTESLGGKVMLTWGPGELDDAENISSMAKSSPIVGMRTESLLELAALFEACDLTITVDSGPMHIGSAVGTPLVAIFGPTDLQVNAPYWQPNKVLSGGLECSPCDEKCDSAKCMDAVKPEDVIKAARELLAKTSTASPGHGPM